MNNIKECLASLIAYPSITPHDAGCQDEIIHFLEELGFQCERLDHPPVSNFFAQYGEGEPLLIFAGHTDVVPIGDRKAWDSEPFVLCEKNDQLYGRGTADMKGSIASMLMAAKRFVQKNPTPSGRLGFLITSGEEGDHFDLGTPFVMSQLQKRGIHPQYCIVGEPSSTHRVGDVVKIGRRGSLTGQLRLSGKQGHVAYPHLAENPIHTISPVLNELTTTQWDEGNEHFPPTSFQITHIKAGGDANNIIPGELDLHFNFRYSTEQTANSLKKAVEQCFAKHSLKAEIQWRLNGEPFITAQGQLLASSMAAILQETGEHPVLSTSGGTSDGRFIAPYNVEVIELGPVNATIHQVNEHVSLTDLTKLAQIYYSICEQLIT